MAKQKSTRKTITTKALASMIEEKLKTAPHIIIENIALKSKVAHGATLKDFYNHMPDVYVSYDKFKTGANTDSEHIKITFRNCTLCDADFIMTSYNHHNTIDIVYENCNVLHFDFRVTSGIRGLYFSNCVVQNCKFLDATGSYIGCTQDEYHFYEGTKCEYCLFENCTGHHFIHSNHEKFIHCKFKKCNFTNCSLMFVTFVDCKADVLTTGYYMACPEKGEYTAYKKACIYFDEKSKNVTTKYQQRKHKGYTKVDYVIVELRIPADAKRSSATTNKCRASKATVISITSIDGKKKYKKALAAHDREFAYVVNKTITPRNGFEENRWDECAPGIHHFISRAAAVDYRF